MSFFVHRPDRFRRSAFPPLVRSALSLFLLLCLVPAHAQDDTTKAPQGADSTAKLEAQNMAILQKYADLAILRFLNPLKLTDDQLKKIEEMLTLTQAEYKRRLVAQLTSLLSKVKEPIFSAHRLALEGSDVLDDEVMGKGVADYYKKQEEIDNFTLRTVSDRLQKIFSKAQITAASKLAKEETIKLTRKEAAGTETQFFNLYVRQVMLNYPRILPLVKEMQTARAGKDKNGKE